MFCQGRVFPVGARLLFLQSFGAAFVAFVVDLEIRSACSQPEEELESYLLVLALGNGFLHWLQMVSGDLGRQYELLVNVLDFLHHVRLELCECLLELDSAFHGFGWGVWMFVACELASDGFVDVVQALGACELVVEDVGPPIAPLCRSFLDLSVSAVQLAGDDSNCCFAPAMWCSRVGCESGAAGTATPPRELACALEQHRQAIAAVRTCTYAL